MNRRLAGGLLAACMLTLALMAVACPDGGGLLRRFVAGTLRPELSSGSTPRVTLPDGRMVVAARRKVTAEEEQGVPQSLGLPAAVQELEVGGSPGADLTAVTARRFYTLGLEPQFRVLYSYPRTDSKDDIIIIEKSRNMLYFYRGGELVARYPVATGKERHFTPEGVFHIAVKLEDPAGDSSSQLGQRWIGLAVPQKSDKRGPLGDTRAPAGEKYGIHGTDEPHTIGSHASAGCVRLHNADVIRLYDQVRVGTAVEIRP